MEIISLPVKGFESNCYIVHNGKDAFVIDPSVSEENVIWALQKNGLSIKGILLTHGHFDHIWKAQELRDKTGAPLYVHELDAEMITDANKNAYRAFTGKYFSINGADALLHEGDEIALGNEKISVLHTPGHTKGSVCFDTGDALFTGDTLFAEGFGRYDLYGGDLGELKASLSRLFKMAESESRWIYCGHGNASSLRQATENLKLYFDI